MMVLLYLFKFYFVILGCYLLEAFFFSSERRGVDIEGRVYGEKLSCRGKEKYNQDMLWFERKRHHSELLGCVALLE